MATLNYATVDWGEDSAVANVIVNNGTVTKFTGVKTLQSAGALGLSVANATIVQMNIVEIAQGRYTMSFIF